MRRKPREGVRCKDRRSPGRQPQGKEGDSPRRRQQRHPKGQKSYGPGRETPVPGAETVRKTQEKIGQDDPENCVLERIEEVTDWEDWIGLVIIA